MLSPQLRRTLIVRNREYYVIGQDCAVQVHKRWCPYSKILKNYQNNNLEKSAGDIPSEIIIFTVKSDSEEAPVIIIATGTIHYGNTIRMNEKTKHTNKLFKLLRRFKKNKIISEASKEQSEKTERDEKKETATERSTPEKKTKKVQKKYGQAPEASIEQRKDDAEAFENVDAQSRPAQTRLRATTLKWKIGDDTQTTEGSRERTSGETVTRGSSSPRSTVKNASKSSSSEGKLSTADLVTAIRQKSENERTLADIPILLKRISELETAQSKHRRTQKRLRLSIRDRDRTIKELTEALNAPQPAIKAIGEEEKHSEHEEKIAKRALEGMRKEQLLERAVAFREMKVLVKFFSAPEAKPDKRVVRIIDKAIGVAIDELLKRPQPADSLVDNEMRLFLLEKIKAKRILLAVMLQQPKYIPDCWGGEAARRPPKSPAATSTTDRTDKTESESEKTTILQTTRQVLGYIFDTSRVPDECAVEVDVPSVQKEEKSESREDKKAEQRRKRSKPERERH